MPIALVSHRVSQDSIYFFVMRDFSHSYWTYQSVLGGLVIFMGMMMMKSGKKTPVAAPVKTPKKSTRKSARTTPISKKSGSVMTPGGRRSARLARRKPRKED